MSRKNIFEIVAGTFDLSKEISRMKELTENKIIVRMSYGRDYSMLEYIRREGFSLWSNRGHCIDVDDYLSLLNYQDLWVKAPEDEQSFFTLVEILYNFWHITNRTAGAAYVRDNSRKNFYYSKQ